MGYKSKIVVFDFETGGLDPMFNPAMEIALVSLDRVTLQEEVIYESLIKNYSINGERLVYHPKALEVHGIDPAQCEREGKSPKELVEVLIRYFKELTPPRDYSGRNLPILCGHNVAFDIGFLQTIFRVAGEDLTKHVLSNNGTIKHIDTMEVAIDCWNDNTKISYALAACCERAGLGNFLAHSAMADTRITADLYRYFIGKLRGNAETPNKGGKTEETVTRPKLVTQRKIKFEF